MKKIIVIASITAAVCLAVACSPKKPAVSSEPAALTKEMALSQFSTAQIAEGETLFNAKCGTCHKLHQPKQFGDARWNKVLNRMLPKAKASDEEGKLIRAYVVANSRDAQG